MRREVVGCVSGGLSLRPRAGPRFCPRSKVGEFSGYLGYMVLIVLYKYNWN